MKLCHGLPVLIISMVLVGSGWIVFTQEAEAGGIQCTMNFTLKGWSVFYKSAEGRGHVSCNNGQNADVKISVIGGGLTFGKMEILDGRGTFSELLDIEEIYGGYIAAEAHAGAVESAQASAYTKGNVSLALTGRGRGFNIGIDFGRFEISKIGR